MNIMQVVVWLLTKAWDKQALARAKYGEGCKEALRFGRGALQSERGRGKQVCMDADYRTVSIDTLVLS